MNRPSPAWLSTEGAGLYVIVALCIAFQALPAELTEALYLRRDRTGAHYFWQMLSAHFAHLSWLHLGFNMLGVAVLQQLFGAQFAGWRCWASFVFFCALLSSFALLAFSTDVVWYCGFSGVLTGLFVYAALLTLRKQSMISALVLLTIGIKIATEQSQGGGIESGGLSAIPVVVDAHLYGALAGALYAGLCCIATHLNRR